MRGGGDGVDRRGSVRLARLLVAASVLLGACADPGEPVAPAGSVGAAQVEVDTPEQRAVREQAGIEPCAGGSGSPVEGGLPPVTLPCLGGGQDVDLSTLRGPLVVNLWASWCTPCRTELPILQEFAETYDGRVAVLGVDFQDVQPLAALELAADSGVTYPLLADPQGDLSAAEPFPPLRGLPFLALVDADGVVAHQEYVALASVEQLEHLVDEHLGVAP